MSAPNGGAMRQACIGCRLEQHLDQFLALRGPARLVATCITCRRAKQRSDASSRRSIQLLQDAAAGRLGTNLRPIAAAPHLPTTHPQSVAVASATRNEISFTHARNISHGLPTNVYHPDRRVIIDHPASAAEAAHLVEQRQIPPIDAIFREQQQTWPAVEDSAPLKLPRIGRPPKHDPCRSPPPPRRRGRPPIQGPAPPPRKRGRPPIQGPALPPPALRKRGRPPMLGPHLPPPPLRKRGRPPLPVPPVSPRSPRRRGRPPGSRNQPKTPQPTSDQLTHVDEGNVQESHPAEDVASEQRSDEPARQQAEPINEHFKETPKQQTEIINQQSVATTSSSDETLEQHTDKSLE
ncbi:hypothetical protein GGS21DRAFT_433717 [Xylaria nigripes]|nr:hypothetical protein GGS21DRAFT_433717 [Xylaria nigripes]